MKQYIVDIKGNCILEDEWEDAKITITRNGIADTIEFDKSDIVKTEEVEEEANEVDKNIKLNRELYLQDQKANPDDTI
jgi:hypothetical protein